VELEYADPRRRIDRTFRLIECWRLWHETSLAYSRSVVISRKWAGFLVAVGVWSWIIWPRFALAIWDDHRAWASGVAGQGAPTSFLWVHAVLIGVSLAIGTIVAVLGIKAWRRVGSARTASRGGDLSRT
jgi:hypothetical protein